MSEASHKRLRERWIAWVLAQHRLVLALALVLTVVSVYLSSLLRVDSDLRSLLPEDHPVLASIDRIETSFGALGSVNVVIKEGSPEQRHALADAIAERAAESPLVRDVEYRLRSDFFAEHALYYLGDAEMEALDEHFQAWTHYELCRAEPDVCLEAPDPEAPKALRTFIRSKQDAALARTSFKDYFERDEISALVLLIHPTQPSSDLDFAEAVSNQIRADVAAVVNEPNTPWAGSGIHYSVVGPYTIKAEERETIRGDMLRSGAFGVIGVLVILYLLFRSGRAVLTLLVPLVCGVTWSMAVTQIVLGRLNAITSLISTVVVGMGIDAGIHFLVRVREEQGRGGDREAIARAFANLIGPLLIASATTLGAFAVMASSAFPAFQEFGLIAGFGVALCLLAMLTVYPAILCLVGVKRVGEPQAARPQPGVLTRVVLARPGLMLGLVAALTVGAAVMAPRAEFENSTRELQSARTRALYKPEVFLISKIFGKDIHAGVLVVSTLDQARAVLTQARGVQEKRLADGTGTVVAELLGAPDLLPDPAIDPARRKETIAAMTSDIPERTWKRLEERAAGQGDDADEGLTPEDARRLQNMLKAEPVTVERLPPAIRDKVYSPDGRFAVYAYPNFDAADISMGLKFMEETAKYTEGVEGLQSDDALFVGETTVYALMYQLMQSEAPTVLAMALVLIAVIVVAQIRSLSRTLWTLAPLLLGMLWLVGLMAAAGVRFTLFNIPILPAILGIGVDNGVYLTDRIRHLRDEAGGIAHALGETGAAIGAATATTAMGFGAFCIADSGGLRGIGVLAVFGIGIAAITAILVLPSVAAIAARRKR
ncbi:efflux RND transporter permease subunit [Nannocystis punicea]|uniref:MMPL family transporter n=1 Tax=Nannocystis punicea TaxID=2995304 RepID=A0ABY7H4B3_9BACT|nr:MMPL family transporter [Nannocystis poenicansa]WAS94106.1 MMPL family transporter [Nannocystis poenicansa]